MHKKTKKRRPMDRSIDHPRAYELRDISQILEENPIMDDTGLRELTRGVEPILSREQHSGWERRSLVATR